MPNSRSILNHQNVFITKSHVYKIENHNHLNNSESNRTKYSKTNNCVFSITVTSLCIDLHGSSEYIFSELWLLNNDCI